jgi:hypothetical protein
MITKGSPASGAVFSDCERYRYRLWRVWDESKPKACFVMLNPSTATQEVLDPTVSRCKKRAETLGYGGLEVVNIFALRSTDPLALYQEPNPVGIHNLPAISEAVDSCEIAICAWGGHGKLHNAGNKTRWWLMRHHREKVHCLRLNSDGSPAHPLYLPYSLQPTPWGLN